MHSRQYGLTLQHLLVTAALRPELDAVLRTSPLGPAIEVLAGVDLDAFVVPPRVVFDPKQRPYGPIESMLDVLHRLRRWTSTAAAAVGRQWARARGSSHGPHHGATSSDDGAIALTEAPVTATDLGSPSTAAGNDLRSTSTAVLLVSSQAASSATLTSDDKAQA